MESDPREERRFPLAEQRDCHFCLITFKDLAWKDHRVQLKDICSQGVGIESETRIDRGFVWFNDPVAGHRGGVLLWNRLVGYRYRAGIQFIPLSSEETDRIGRGVQNVRAHQPLRDPETIIATIIGSLSHQDRRPG